MTTALVTGATGFIGRHLVAFLCSQPSVKVISVSRRPVGSRPSGGEQLNLESSVAVHAWLGGAPEIDVVFHLAARLPGQDEPDSAGLLEGNRAMSAHAIEVSLARKAHLIYASSAYLCQPSTEVIDEACVPSPVTFYHRSKLLGEQLCEAAEARGLTSARLRIAAPYGPGQAARSVLPIFVDRARRSEDLLVDGSGARTQDFIHVTDVVRAMWLSWETRAGGVFNVASGRSVSMWELAQLVCRGVSGTRSTVRLSGRTDPQEHVRWRFATDRARDRLGFVAAVDLAEGLRQLAL